MSALMYVKITNGAVDQWPYTIERFRADNPNTAFPELIPASMLRRYGVFPVAMLPAPAHNPLKQRLVLDAAPSKQVVRYKTEADATNPITGEVDQSQLGQPIYGNEWVIGYQVEDKPDLDQTPQNIGLVKAEAYRRIVTLCPEWKQRNLTAQAAQLAKKGEANWTEAEGAAWAAGEALWAQIAGIRAASDTLEAMSPIPVDFADDQHWP